MDGSIKISQKIYFFIEMKRIDLITRLVIVFVQSVKLILQFFLVSI